MTPDTMFKFVNVRAVQLAPKATGHRYAAYGQGQSPLHAQMAALSGDQARAQAAALAERFLSSDAYKAGIDPRIQRVREATAKEPGAQKAKAAAEKIVGKPLSQWLATEEAKKLKDFIWDAVYAHTVASNVLPERREDAYGAARTFALLEELAGVADDDAHTKTASLTPDRVVIPADLLRQSGKRPPADSRAEALEGIRRTVRATAEKAVSMYAAADDLRRGEQLLRAEPSTVAALPRQLPQDELTPLRGIRPDGPSFIANASKVLEKVEVEGGTRVVMPRRLAIHQSPRAAEVLASTTRTLVEERGSALTSLGAAKAAEALEEEAYQLASALVTAIPRGAYGAIAHETPLHDMLTRAHVPFVPPLIPPPALPRRPTPEIRGIRPLGIGDLLVVKQKLLRYEAGEIAHVENILKSEKKDRVHKRMRETEETVVTEVEQLEESEKNLQTTERFELHKEAEKTIETTTSFDAGVAVSASYGPVSVNAHADFALNNSMSESSKTASNYAREVTEKAVSRVQRRTREERTRRTLERFEETNEHGFDNTQGTGHVIGVYRWLDKYYKARVVNYGRRMMVEFVVPEPAAFYLYVTQNRPMKGVTLKKPDPPLMYGAPLAPKQLSRNNYSRFLSMYGVQDAEAYPEAEIRVGGSLVAKKPDASAGNIPFAETSKELTIEKGYQAWDVYGQYDFGGYDKSWLSVMIGGESFGNVTAHGMEGTIPITVSGWCTELQVNVTVICELTEERIEKWQLKTYAAIMSAYENALAHYNEQVAAAQIQQGVEIEGRNPANNRKLERDELRKAALRVLTDDFAFLRVSGQSFFNYEFHAMSDSVGSYGYPEFDTTTAMLEGKIIQFFEQAFEWNNMVYRFYPYFWGRKENWDERYPLTDPDPMFVDFLRAGAARVVVPVHPGYAETFLYYLHTGEIWSGGEPPTIDDPLYVSIIEELRSDASVNDSGDGLPQCSTTDPTVPCIVDEWEVKVPTDLVYLQRDASLSAAVSGISITGVVSAGNKVTLALSGPLPEGTWVLDVGGNRAMEVPGTEVGKANVALTAPAGAMWLAAATFGNVRLRDVTNDLVVR